MVEDRFILQYTGQLYIYTCRPMDRSPTCTIRSQFADWIIFSGNWSVRDVGYICEGPTRQTILTNLELRTAFPLVQLGADDIESWCISNSLDKCSTMCGQSGRFITTCTG